MNKLESAALGLLGVALILVGIGISAQLITISILLGELIFG